MDRIDGSDEIYLIGCSRSVLDLTPAECARINRARCVMGLNKFIYFHKIANILPTHVWFTDYHPPSPRILGDIFAACRRDGLRGLTFVLDACYQKCLRVGVFRYHAARVRRRLRLRRSRNWPLMLAPASCRYEFVTRHDWLEGGCWATRIDEPLYSLRTAFTSALNYLAIQYPGSTIRLVGTDFNTRGYFFDEEMLRLALPWDDWTASMQSQHGTHSASIEYNGATVFDGFPYMREHLNQAGIRLTCNNPDSEPVVRGLASYAPIGSISDNSKMAST
ncbi:hypothetical protein [Tautonia rosea]|uniref:hypothetical protein n=1 Tax=Tautonia rosea TaxID=2728037 RepID=UPI0014760FF8|nr:hypothetical protein [Tautonia rosea]